FDVTQSKTKDLAGFVEFDLPPGEYSYRLLLTDGIALDRRSAQPKMFVVPDPAKEDVWRPFFVDEVRTDGNLLEITPTGLGGEAPFANSAEAAVPFVGSLEGVDIEYFLYSVTPENEEAIQKAGRMNHYNIRNGDVLVRQGRARTVMSLGADADDCFCRDLPADTSAHLAFLDLDTEMLEAGFYVVDVRVKRGDKSASSQLIFTTHWRDMPLSLYDVEVAIRNLEFIDTKERVRSLLKGSRRERIEQLRAYWKQRDPTPSTLANELMEEYYRRVDHAALEFRTGGAPYPDGLRADAARIYIVNGPPEEVTHAFPSSGGVEQVWRYGDGREFVFRSESSLEPLVLVEDRG
ncbi:MAG: GWxTD domain-containing protein, partial [Rhodothermales bacterium]